MTKTIFLTSTIAGMTVIISVLLLLLNAAVDAQQPSNPCGPSSNAASPYAPGGPGGYPPGQNPFNPAPGGAPGQLKQDQTPLP